MYHPAAALRQQSLKETMLTDMCGLPDVLIQSREARAERGAGDTLVPVSVAVGSQPLPEPELSEVEVQPALEAAAQADVAETDDAVTVAVGPHASPQEPQLELFG
jgi:hypothetical protein